jgi:hypothetical protein
MEMSGHRVSREVTGQHARGGEDKIPVENRTHVVKLAA